MGERLPGKVAAITGAGSGIGRECTRIVLSAGARVVVIDRDADALKSVCAEFGPQATPLQVDVTAGPSVSRLMPQGIISVIRLPCGFASGIAGAPPMAAAGAPSRSRR
jgi:NADP-dependent 3-hydroxy acid dehydrogenase YdfG